MVDRGNPGQARSKTIKEETSILEYIKVRWLHELAYEPTWLYSELDEGRWEVRKVDVYADGHYQYADETSATGDTRLGLVPTPGVVEIGNQQEFEPCLIDRDEFEEVWRAAAGMPTDG